MKFIVDEMPYFQGECLFFEFGSGECKLDGCECEYMTNHQAGQRCPDDCRWLTVKEGVRV